VKNIELFGFSEQINTSGIELIHPLSYLQFLSLWRNAFVVFTDSCGFQQETTALGIPCLTIRENTECPVTISEGTNYLAGITKGSILRTYEDFKHRKKKKNKIPKYWDGKSAERVVEILLNTSR
jgi:UDP-N-acetylglucosamine 2-epimerase (non-hydrolysing)